MNRRKAIQQIGIFALSTQYFASCDFSKSPENILEAGQKQFLQALSNLLLPIDYSKFETPETVTNFIITMVKECESPEDIQVFQDGLTAIQQSAKATFKDFSTLKQPDVDSWTTQLLKAKNQVIPTTLKTIKTLHIKHLQTSEFYLKSYTDYEFAPGRFIGCVKI